MPWEKKVRPEHDCRRPDFVGRRRVAYGSIWRCRKCGTRWEATVAFGSSCWQRLPESDTDQQRQSVLDDVFALWAGAILLGSGLGLFLGLLFTGRLW